MGGPHAAAQGRRRGVHPGPRGVPQHTKGVQKEGGDGSLFQERRGRDGEREIHLRSLREEDGKDLQVQAPPGRPQVCFAMRIGRLEYSL